MMENNSSNNRLTELYSYDWFEIVDRKTQNAMRMRYLIPLIRHSIIILGQQYITAIKWGGRLAQNEKEALWVDIKTEESMEDWELTSKKTIALLKEYNFLNEYGGEVKIGKDTITQKDIDMARTVPISSLDTFNKGNFMRSFYSRDRSASLQYYPETNTYFCRSTNQGGDVIKFMMDRDGLDFLKVVKFLSKK